MRYIVTGHVLPERTAVSFPPLAPLPIPGGGSARVFCDASQITVVLDDCAAEGCLDAYLLADMIAGMAVGALGFALGTGYHVELVQVVNVDGCPFVFGVRPAGDEGQSLGFAASEEMREKCYRLSLKDAHFRMSLRDYLHAMRDPMDCPFYCYRAVEGLRHAYKTMACKDGWEEMHLRLGTNRDSIVRTLKGFADPVRHGDWVKTQPTSAQDRWAMLQFTRNILERHVLAADANIVAQAASNADSTL